MSTSSDSAEEIVRLSLEGFEVVARLTGNMAKEMAVLLYAMSKDTKKKTKGQTRINNMLKSNSNLRIFTIKKDEYQDFKKQAKRYGVLYSALYKKSEKNKDGVIDILVREEDAVRVNRIIERFNLTTVDTTKIEKIDIEKEQKKEEKVEVQKAIQEKNTSDDLLNKLLKKEPVNEENDTPSNIQNTEKETQLENLLKTREKNEKIKEEKPSMREELNKIKQEKAEKEKIKSKEEIKETSKKERNNETKHKQPKKRKKKKERSK